MPRKTACYGWIPDLPDHRDFSYAAPVRVLAALPPKTDLTGQCPAVYDQGRIGSCTANAIGAAVEFDHLKQKLPDFMPSRLFIYYNERAMEGTIDSDSGAQLRDGIKSVAQQGVCPETLWPYDPSPYPPNPRLALKPSAAACAEAKNHTAVQYQRVPQALNQLKGCIASGYPFVFGFAVYESFESEQVTRTGVVPMPKPGEHCIGGHAVMAVGYDDSQRRFMVRNSWGAAWGMKGCFTMPYPYLTDDNLASDFWTVRVVT